MLVQHNVLWHAKGDDDVEMFELNVDECLIRLRFGRFIWLSEQIFGPTVSISWVANDAPEVLICCQAAEIVQLILDHGKLRPPDVLSLLHVHDSKSTLCHSFSALSTKCSLEISQINQTFHKLVSGTYLKPSTLLSHLSPRDKCIQYEAEEKRKIIGFPTAKELRQAKEVAEARLRQEEEEEEKAGLVRCILWW